MSLVVLLTGQISKTRSAPFMHSQLTHHGGFIQGCTTQGSGLRVCATFGVAGVDLIFFG